MLVQSHDGFVELLPAIPDEWAQGSFKGLKVRGGAEVSAEWKDHKLQRVEILASVDNRLKLKVPANISSVYVDDKAVEIKDGFVNLHKEKNERIVLTFD